MAHTDGFWVEEVQWDTDHDGEQHGLGEESEGLQHEEVADELWRRRWVRLAEALYASATREAARACDAAVDRMRLPLLVAVGEDRELFYRCVLCGGVAGEDGGGGWMSIGRFGCYECW
jgi:hypothetical protein